jgi:tetratricopeptide (TPR) repeat protein
MAPDDPLILCYLSQAHYDMGGIEEAVNQLLLALEKDPRCPEAHFQLGVAFAAAKIYREAIREWEAVLASGDDTPLARQARANIAEARAILDAPR